MSEAALQHRSAVQQRPQIQASEWRSLVNWLLIWVVFANAGFALMYLVGSPPRFSEIILFCVVGLIVRDKPYSIQCCAFVVATVYSLLSFIAALFNLNLLSLAHSVTFFVELDVRQSIEYLAGGAVILGLVGGAFGLLKRPTNFQDFRMTLVAVAATGTLVLVDLWLGSGMRGHYNRTASADTPFMSAIEQSGITPPSGVLERNLVVVMVESLGVPIENPEMRELLFARYRSPDVTSLFEISHGETTFFNSTTAGEIRELCGRWGDYFDLVDRADRTCLPARLAAGGAKTTAYHSFEGKFFDRNIWYPNIGFDKLVFREELLAGGALPCGGVFPGACDRNVPRQIAEQLKGARSPQFVYWLTVNSHLPIPRQNNLGVDQCERVSSELAAEFPMICRQFAIWDAIDAAIVREITATDFPPTDILLVGDHMPPYFERENRRHFAPDRVPWILLKWRELPESG